MATGKTINVRFSGQKEIGRKFGKYGRAVADAIPGALFREANRIMTDSKKLVPVDTGALRSTGHVEEPVRKGRKVSVEIGYGGPAGSGGSVEPGKGRSGNPAPGHVGYAVLVHEDMTAGHVVGQAKYLETPIKQRKPTMMKRIAADASRTTRRRMK